MWANETEAKFYTSIIEAPKHDKAGERGTFHEQLAADFQWIC